MSKPDARFRSLALAASLTLFPCSVFAQQTNAPTQTPTPSQNQTQTTSAATPSPSATAKTERAREADLSFDTLLPADGYVAYGEVRRVGEFVRSGAFAEFAQPLTLTMMGEARGFNQLLSFLNAHAVELQTSPLLFAAEPMREGLPENIFAVELATPEAAAKFAPALEKFLLKLSGVEETKESDKAKPDANKGKSSATAAKRENETDKPPAVKVFVKRTGKMVVFSEYPFEFKTFAQADAARLITNPGFAAARNRMSSETLFIYYDLKLKSLRAKRAQLEYEKARAEMERNAVEAQTTNMKSKPDNLSSVNETTEGKTVTTETASTDSTSAMNSSPTPAPSLSENSQTQAASEDQNGVAGSSSSQNDVASVVLPSLGLTFSSPKWTEAMPQAIGVGANLESDALALRALLINGDAPMTSPVPFLPIIASNAPVSADAPTLAPDDSEIVIRASLDLTKMYETALAVYDAKQPTQKQTAQSGEAKPNAAAEQIAALEKLLGFSVKDDLLASLGNEVVFVAPASYFGVTQRRGGKVSGDEPAQASGFAAFVALNDADKINNLLPRLARLSQLGGALQTQKYQDADLITVSGATLAVVDTWLVVAPDLKTMQHTLDARANGRTLNLTDSFSRATEWQPRQTYFQVYISKDLLQLYFKAERANIESFDDAAKTTLASYDFDFGAITHTATNDNGNYFHELHIPKNLITAFFTLENLTGKQSPLRSAEFEARYKLSQIHRAEIEYFKKHGRYAALAELKRSTSNFKPPRVMVSESEEGNEFGATDYESAYGYKLELKLNGDDFEITATPKEYGKTVRHSFYMDKSGVLRGADHKGKAATKDDPEIQQD